MSVTSVYTAVSSPVHENGISHYILLIGVCLIVQDLSGFLKSQVVTSGRQVAMHAFFMLHTKYGSERGLLRQGMHHGDRGDLG